MMPVQIQLTGTAISTPFLPDIFQNPFNIGIGLSLQTGGLTTAIVAVEHCFDYATVYAPSFNGKTALLSNGTVGTAVWFQNSGVSGGTTAIGTTISVGIETSGLNANYAFPVAAIRVSVTSATATSIIIVNFIQASNAP